MNIETMRYYKQRGLLPLPPRTASNYRQYSPETVTTVRFIKRAQELGFSLNEIQESLCLGRIPGAQCAEVHDLAQRKSNDVGDKIRSLQAMREALSSLLGECPGNAAITECPILEALEEANRELN